MSMFFFFFFQAEDGIRDDLVTGVQTCALPISISTSFPGPPNASMPPITFGPVRVVIARSFMSPSSARVDCTNWPAIGNGGFGALQIALWVLSDVHEPIAVMTAPGSVTVTL